MPENPPLAMTPTRVKLLKAVAQDEVTNVDGIAYNDTRKVTSRVNELIRAGLAELAPRRSTDPGWWRSYRPTEAGYAALSAHVPGWDDVPTPARLPGRGMQ